MALRVLTQNTQQNQEDIARISEDSGVDLKDCYQCGKCSAGCPIAAEADMTPREIIRNLQLGLVDPVLESKMPWYCVECGVCLVRCPQKVDLPALNEAICRLAMRQKKGSVREGARFMNIFLDNVQHKGVSDEAMLAGRFNLETGHLMQDVLSAPKMMQRGLLAPLERSYKPEGADDVRRIVKACRDAEAQEAAQVRAEQREQTTRERTRVSKARLDVLREMREEEERAASAVADASEAESGAPLSASDGNIALEAVASPRHAATAQAEGAPSLAPDSNTARDEVAPSGHAAAAQAEGATTPTAGVEGGGSNEAC